jgi:hypothetical protein
MILSPRLSFEHLQSTSTIAAGELDGPLLEKRMAMAAAEAVRARGLSAVDCFAGDPAEATTCSALEGFATDLSRGRATPEARAVLPSADSGAADIAVLASSMRGKLGPGGYWDPNSGAIRKAMSSVTLRAALVRVQDQQTLWSNQVLLRDIPDHAAEEFQESLQLLYQSLPTVGRSQTGAER